MRWPDWGAALAATLALGLLSVAAPARAAGGPTQWDGCFQKAGDYYRINPLLLKAIARQESSMNPRAVGKNTNGTVDLGMMQINTTWLPKLARAGVRREHLMDPCVNIMVGAWVLADGVRRFGMSWKAVGVYHSPTPWRQQSYAAKVQRHLIREIHAVGGAAPQAAVAPQRPAARPPTAAAGGATTGVIADGGARMGGAVAPGVVYEASATGGAP